MRRGRSGNNAAPAKFTALQGRAVRAGEGKAGGYCQGLAFCRHVLLCYKCQEGTSGAPVMSLRGCGGGLLQSSRMLRAQGLGAGGAAGQQQCWHSGQHPQFLHPARRPPAAPRGATSPAPGLVTRLQDGAGRRAGRRKQQPPRHSGAITCRTGGGEVGK